MTTKGKSRGQNWSEHEIQALVSPWSEEGLQRELKKSLQNDDLAYARISRICLNWNESTISFPFQVVPRCGNIGKGLASVPDPRHPTLHRTTYDSISDECSYNFA